MAFRDKVYHMVEQIPKGKVATYGQIAFLCGKLRAARVVGNALHENPFEGCVPCHRVVNAKGELSGAFEMCIRDRCTDRRWDWLRGCRRGCAREHSSFQTGSGLHTG